MVLEMARYSLTEHWLLDYPSFSMRLVGVVAAMVLRVLNHDGPFEARE